MLSLLLSLSTVYCIDASWKAVPGELTHVQIDPYDDYVCGVSKANTGYCSNSLSVSWYPLPGKIKQITAARGALFAIDGDSNLVYSPSAEKDQVSWKSISTPMIQVSFDGTTVCGVTPQNDIHCATENKFSLPNWHPIISLGLESRKVKEVVVRGNKLYAVTTTNELFYSSSVLNAFWTRIPGTFKQIQFDGTTLCGTNPSNEAFCASSNLDSNPAWERVTGSVNLVNEIAVAYAGALFGIANGKVFAGTIPGSMFQLRSDWQQDYLQLGANRSEVLEDARTRLISGVIPSNVTEYYANEGSGTITYLCGVNNTYGRFPIRQHMDIGNRNDGSYVALDVVGDGFGELTHQDRSSVALRTVLRGILDPVNSNRNGGWFAFALSPTNPRLPRGKLTGATYGFRNLVKGGRTPSSCDTVGQEATFNIVATYHLFR